MIPEVELIEKEIKKVLNSENLRFEMNRKFPEILTKVDFFVYTSIPTIIEVVSLSPMYIIRKSLLISKLISIKLINDGNIRLITVFYQRYQRYGKIQENFGKATLIKSVTDDFIVIKQEFDKDKEFHFSELDIVNLKQALKNKIEEKKIIQKIVRFEEIKVSHDRVNYTLNNISKFLGRESLILSFYYNCFKNDMKYRLKEIFISDLNDLRDFNQKEFDNKSTGRFYPLNNPEDEFKKFFMSRGWNFDDVELQAIIFEFTPQLFRRFKNRSKNEFKYFQEPFFDILINEINRVQENFINKSRSDDKESEYKKILTNNGYYFLNKNLLIYLLYYCLRNSNFKKELLLKKLTVFDEVINYYQYMKFNNKIIILKVLDLGTRIESFFSLVYFGRYLKAYFHNEIELIVFLKNSTNSGDFIRKTQNTKKKIINLEENGWKTYPFQNFEENTTILNKIFDEELFNE